MTETDLTGDDDDDTKVARGQEDVSISAREGEAHARRLEGGDTPSPPFAPRREVVNTPSDDAANDDEAPEVAGEEGRDWRDLPHIRILCRRHPFEPQRFQGHANAPSCENCW